MMGSFTEVGVILAAATGAAVAWGGPPAKEPAASSPALRRAGSIVAADYPADAPARREVGTTRVRYIVHENGRVSGCRVLASSGSVALDRTACTLIERRYRFRPAADAAGTPISEIRTDEVDWSPSAMAPPAAGAPASAGERLASG